MGWKWNIVWSLVVEYLPSMYGPWLKSQYQRKREKEEREIWKKYQWEKKVCEVQSKDEQTIVTCEGFSFVFLDPIKDEMR